MTRSAAREIAIHCSYSLGFSNQSPEEFLEERMDRVHFQRWGEESPLYQDYPNDKQMQYIREVVRGVFPVVTVVDDVPRNDLRVLRREGGNDGIVPLLRFQVKQIAQNAVPLVILQITDFIQTVHEAKADVLHRVLSADGGSKADHADLLVPMGQLPVFHNVHLINLLYACQGV